MKHFPESLVIGQQTFTVHLIPELQSDDGAFLFGQVLYGNLRIEINSSNDSSWWMPTLLHEALHVLFLHSGHCYTEVGEEPVVAALGMGLHQLLTQNPVLLKTLGEKRVSAAPSPTLVTVKAASGSPRRPKNPPKQRS